MARRKTVINNEGQFIGNVESPHGQVTVAKTKRPKGDGRFIEQHLALVVGLGLFVLAIILAFAFGTPTGLQTRIILGAFSLGGGAIATEISGMIKVDLKLGNRLVIAATGALAIFVILYLVVPA